MSDRVCRFGVGTVLVGGVAALTLTLGIGGVHDTAADRAVDISLTGSSDLLEAAVTDFLEAKDVYTGIDTSELSDSVLGAVGAMERMPGIVDRMVDLMGDRLEPAEAAILGHSGSLADLIDQLFFAPLNQQWADAGESMLDATQAFDAALADGSMPDVIGASFDVLGVIWLEAMPAVFASVPIVWVGSLFDPVDMAAFAGPDYFDFLF